jgi:hypothetical protein
VSDTPRTDAVLPSLTILTTQESRTLLEHARTLERELAEMRELHSEGMDRMFEALALDATYYRKYSTVVLEIKHLKSVAAGWHDKATAAGVYARALTAAATKMRDEFRKEFHCARAEAEKWEGFVNGFDPSEPLEAAYLALDAALAAPSVAQGCEHDFAPAAYSESGERVVGRACLKCGAREEYATGSVEPRVIAADATIDPENVTDKDCADLAACIEREHVKKVIRDTYAMIRTSGYAVTYRMTFEAGLDELSFRLMESWGEENPHALADENNAAPDTPPAQDFSTPAVHPPKGEQQ